MQFDQIGKFWVTLTHRRKQSALAKRNIMNTATGLIAIFQSIAQDDRSAAKAQAARKIKPSFRQTQPASETYLESIETQRQAKELRSDICSIGYAMAAPFLAWAAVYIILSVSVP